MGMFTWKPGDQLSEWADLNQTFSPGGSSSAHCNQAVDILRRQLHRDEAAQPKFNGIMVTLRASYLTMLDGGYFGDKLPVPTAACPEDRELIIWQRNLNTPSQGVEETGGINLSPGFGEGFEYYAFTPFESSYYKVPAAISVNEVGAPAPASGTSPGSHLVMSVPGVMRTPRVDEVMFPSQKVSTYDYWDRHNSRQKLWHAYPEARQPLLFFDGSVVTRKTGDANKGWNPLDPSGPIWTVYFYAPMAKEPPTLSGAATEQVSGYYRWTRNGLKGIDYGGKLNP